MDLHCAQLESGLSAVLPASEHFTPCHRRAARVYLSNCKSAPKAGDNSGDSARNFENIFSPRRNLQPPFSRELSVEESLSAKTARRRRERG